MKIRYLSLYFAFALLNGCSSPEGSSVTLNIVSPIANSNLSGSFNTQVNLSDTNSVQQVEVYARELGSSSTGLRLGISKNPITNTTYSITSSVDNLPNGTAVELYAQAQTSGGKISSSDGVKVNISNLGSPNLRYFAGYNLPAALSTQSARSRLEGLTSKVLPPLEWVKGLSLNSLPVNSLNGNSSSGTRQDGVSPRAAEVGRSWAVEWGWDPLGGAKGYGIYLNTTGLIGTYTRQKGQQANGTGLQKYAQPLKDLPIQSQIYGLVTGVGLTGETPYSNAYLARFLETQLASSPVSGSQVQDGRPVLTWLKNSSPTVVGYLYFLYKNNPLLSSDPPLWSNPDGRAIAQQSVRYPATRDALTTGTYFWWIAALSFNDDGIIDGLSFSEPQSFKVP